MATLSVHEQQVTVLFSDIENFTKICESLGEGDKLLNLMSDYFTAMSEIITSTGGCLLEFIGDSVLAVWNAPNPEEMHAVLAVTAALEMHAFLESVAEEWDKKGYPIVRITCGIHTAKVLVGNLGAPNRMKYGMLGDGVNTASRLEETNKRYATHAL
jgi:adenylate cyclase